MMMTNLLIFLEYIQSANLEHLDDFLRYLTFQLRYIYIMNFHNTWLFQPLGC